jgi:hypothetical protein
MSDAILRCLWVSAILYWRTPESKKRKDHCERWSEIDALAIVLGYPAAPMTASWCQNL